MLCICQTNPSRVVVKSAHTQRHSSMRWKPNSCGIISDEVPWETILYEHSRTRDAVKPLRLAQRTEKTNYQGETDSLSIAAIHCAVCWAA